MITLRVLKSNFKNCLYLGVGGVEVGKIDITSQAEEVERLKKTIRSELDNLGGKIKVNFEAKINKSLSIDDLNILKNELKIFRFTGKSKEELVKGINIKLDFSKSGNESFYLSELPDEITSIEYKGQVYNRAIGSRKGEFISDKFEILKSEDKMEFTIKETREKNSVSEKAIKDNESIEKSKSPLDKAILLKIKERGFNDKILADEIKKGLLSDEEGIISDNFEVLKPDEKTKKEKEFNDFMLEKYPGYPNNLSKLNEKIDELLSEYRYNKGAYHTPKKLLEEVAKIKDKEKQEEKVREILQPQVELAIKTSPENWTDKISTENPEIEAIKGSPIFQLLNLFFKGILGVDLFKSLGKDYDKKAKEKVGSMIGGKESEELGSLSETHESGGKGPYAINQHDGNGPSFGTYQLHGDMLKDFAKENGIELGLKESKFEEKWNKKIKEMGVNEFRKKEHEFIKKTHYDKQVNKISRETFWVNPNNFSMSLKNVIWSVSVQHGADSEIVVEAINNLGKKLDYSDLNNQKRLIEEIYKVRTKVFPRDSKRYRDEKFTSIQNLNINLSEPITNNKGEKVNIPKGIKSFPQDSKNGVPTCSRTAYKNLTQVFGINIDEKIGKGSAKAVYEKYGGTNNSPGKNMIGENRFPPEEGKVADIFVDSNNYPMYKSTNSKGKEINQDDHYGHRAVAFIDNGKWFILDPYLPAMNSSKTTNPIPWEIYKSYLNNTGRKFFGAKVY